MTAVAEVEDPGDAFALVEEEVVEVEVAVNDLSAQAFPLRQHTLLEPVEDASDERFPRRIADLVEQRPQLRGGAHVPEQLAAGRRVEERTEREAETGVHRGELTYRGIVELGPGLVADPPLEQAHLMAVEDPSWCQRPSQRQLRIDGGNVRDRGLLEVEHDLVLAWIRDL